jgi:hypothetical protein
MTDIEAQLFNALQLVKEYQQENGELKKALTKARREHAHTRREYLLRSSGLSQASMERIHKAFATSIDNAGLDAAIKVERRGAA